MVQNPPVVGVLALQGAFAKHAEMLRHLGATVVEVRKPADLACCDGLIIPGGESTTIFKQIAFIELAAPLQEFAKTKPIFGTCAGLIVISKEILGDTLKPFKLLDVAVERNAFGRQADSFHTEIEVALKPGTRTPFPAVFIRAPRIRHVDSNVKVLAEFEGEPVLVQQGHHLGATFHPELSHNEAIHAYFLKLL